MLALDFINICAIDFTHDWRKELVQYLEDPTINTTKKLKLRATLCVVGRNFGQET